MEADALDGITFTSQDIAEVERTYSMGVPEALKVTSQLELARSIAITVRFLFERGYYDNRMDLPEFGNKLRNNVYACNGS